MKYLALLFIPLLFSCSESPSSKNSGDRPAHSFLREMCQQTYFLPTKTLFEHKVDCPENPDGCLTDFSKQEQEKAVNFCNQFSDQCVVDFRGEIVCGVDPDSLSLGDCHRTRTMTETERQQYLLDKNLTEPVFCEAGGTVEYSECMNALNYADRETIHDTFEDSLEALKLIPECNWLFDPAYRVQE